MRDTKLKHQKRAPLVRKRGTKQKCGKTTWQKYISNQCNIF